MNPATELYREVVLDHRRNPRHKRRLASATHHARGANLACGDEVEIDLRFDGDRVAGVGFGGQGCTIGQASASMMCEAIAGRTRDEIDAIVASFHRMLSGDGAVDEEMLGDAAALVGVRRFPARVTCAALPWATLRRALADDASADAAW